MTIVEDTTKGYPTPVSEHDRTVKDSPSGPPPAAAGDHVDAVIHQSASTDNLNIDMLVHKKADVLVASSTVSGIHLTFYFPIMTCSSICNYLRVLPRL